MAIRKHDNRKKEYKTVIIKDCRIKYMQYSRDNYNLLYCVDIVQQSFFYLTGNYFVNLFTEFPEIVSFEESAEQIH